MIQRTIPRQVNLARTITRAAEQQIKMKTGMKVTLVLCPDTTAERSPEQMLSVIAAALNMDCSAYRTRSRERNYVDLRFIAAYMLRNYFPSIPLQQITVFFGGQDHTSIMNGLQRTGTLLAIGDEKFTCKYEKALKSVNKWLKKEESGYVSAISA